MPVTVYNASGKNVLVKVTSDTISERQRELGIWSFAGKANETYQPTSKSGFSMVQKYSEVEFFPEKNKSTAYISIKPTDEKKSMYMFLCEDHPIKAEGSGVIISKDFYLRIAQDKWTDTVGYDHNPYKKEEGSQKEVDESRIIKTEPSGIKYLQKAKSDAEQKKAGIVTSNGNATETFGYFHFGRR